MVRCGKKYCTSCSVVAYGKVGCYDVGRCYGGIVMSLGHCVITWLGPGAGGGIRPSSHQDSASKTPSVYGVAEYGILSSSMVYIIGEQRNPRYSIIHCTISPLTVLTVDIYPHSLKQTSLLKLTFKTHELRLY